MAAILGESIVESVGASARLALPYIQSLASLGTETVPGEAALRFAADLGLSPDIKLSANKIFRTLQNVGLGARRQDVLALVRGIRNQQLSMPYISSVGLDKNLNPQRFGQSIHPMKRAYSYTVRLQGTHSQTGGMMTQYINVASDRLLTKQQAMDIAAGYVDGDPAAYEMAVQRMVVENALYDPNRISF